ncbi:MAG: 23S rRNA (guanosine(2251)-2'-O)-methyltransferase RlmB [Christensenellaceae bacterium]|jgi:TrmH family RNA methyltransferase
MKEKITSTQNETIKKIRALKQRKFRKETGLFLAEGRKCAEEALRYANVTFFCTVNEADPLLPLINSEKTEILLVSPEVLASIAEVKTPQECIAVVQKESAVFVPETYQEIIVFLEDVSDPANVGAIIRTADAVAASAVLFSKTTADYTSPRAVRAAMGSGFHLPMVEIDEKHEVITQLKESGFWVVGTHLAGEENAPALKASKTCLVVGNEARGLSEEMASICDQLLKIPMYGKAESLNVSVATGIMLYQLKNETLQK